MKKLFTFIFCMIAVTAIYSQELPNFGFENWSNQFLYEAMDDWNTSNSQGTPDMTGITKSTDAYSGDYSIKLQPLLQGEDTIFNFIYHGTVTDGPSGGMAYTDEFDQVKGMYKCNMPEDDSATIYIIKWYGVTPSQVISKVGGVHETWTEFTVDVTGGTCDSVFVGFISSDILEEDNIEFDSWVMFDSIYFNNTMGATPSAIPNHDMENWSDVECLWLDDWYNVNAFLFGAGLESVSQTEDAYAGTYAAQLIGHDIYGDVIPGYLSIGEITFDDMDPILGIPYAYQPDYLTGYYKYIPSSDDDAYMVCTMTAEDVEVGGNLFTFADAAEWTYFEIPLMYSDVPDECELIFSSGELGGSVLFLDDVQFEFSTDVTQNINNEIIVYPNPASDYVIIAGLEAGQYISVFDMQGRLVLSEQVSNSYHKTSLRDLNSGMYIIETSANPQNIIKLIVK